ncbi:HSP20-like chaperones superfamily protein [Striga hermonthica]|uniref:HSP20-like chaperones superfamily protein n=1 Tax=Striga hermonthica TaxID=68872 RepID=A0A9N7RSP7_STRHE|nr:HSP20-like chaperones superfamily protein [Striga hermonthica]
MAGKAHQEVPTYEEFEPLCQWQRNKDRDILEIHLQGFKKDQLRVQISNHGVLKISGERPVDTSSKSRFHKEVPAPSSTYDAQSIQAKFTNGHLYITMPKINHEPDDPKVPPPSEPAEADRTPKPESAAPDRSTADPPTPASNESGKTPGFTKLAVGLAAAAVILAAVVAWVVYMQRSSAGRIDWVKSEF